MNLAQHSSSISKEPVTPQCARKPQQLNSLGCNGKPVYAARRRWKLLRSQKVLAYVARRRHIATQAAARRAATTMLKLYRTSANFSSCGIVSTPVRRPATDIARLPENRPSVPASVASKPARMQGGGHRLTTVRVHHHIGCLWS